MKILILEDDENRIKKFKKWFIGCELYITHLVTQANEWIETENFDYIFLDHDLEEEHYKVWDYPTVLFENTGYTTAKFIGDNPEFCPKAHIIIHSLNPFGQNRMKMAMSKRKVDICPFTYLRDRLIIR